MLLCNFSAGRASETHRLCCRLSSSGEKTKLTREDQAHREGGMPLMKTTTPVAENCRAWRAFCRACRMNSFKHTFLGNFTKQVRCTGALPIWNSLEWTLQTCHHIHHITIVILGPRVDRLWNTMEHPKSKQAPLSTWSCFWIAYSIYSRMVIYLGAPTWCAPAADPLQVEVLAASDLPPGVG